MLGEIGELADEVDRAGVRRARHRREAQRHETGGAVQRDRLGGRTGVQPEALVGRNHSKRLRREPKEVQPSRDRKVRLVADVHARALEVRASRGFVEPEQPCEMHVPSEREPHDVRHHATRCEDAPAPVAEPKEVREPADHVLLYEGSRHTREPQVESLVHPRGESLPGDRHR